MLIAVPRPKRAKPEEHGGTKSRYQIMLTDSANELLDKMADELGITRSEVLERLIRCGGLECAKRFNPETGKCDGGAQ